MWRDIFSHYCVRRLQRLCCGGFVIIGTVTVAEALLPSLRNVHISTTQTVCLSLHNGGRLCRRQTLRSLKLGHFGEFKPGFVSKHLKLRSKVFVQHLGCFPPIASQFLQGHNGCQSLRYGAWSRICVEAMKQTTDNDYSVLLSVLFVLFLFSHTRVLHVDAPLCKTCQWIHTAAASRAQDQWAPPTCTTTCFISQACFPHTRVTLLK